MEIGKANFYCDNFAGFYTKLLIFLFLSSKKRDKTNQRTKNVDFFHKKSLSNTSEKYTKKKINFFDIKQTPRQRNIIGSKKKPICLI